MSHLVKPSLKIFSTILIGMLFMIACSKESNKPQQKASSASASVSSTNANGRELKNAPDFTLEKMNGEMFTLSEHEGQVIILNIWATWCPPCRKEIPYFIKLQEKMRSEGVLFVGVSMDREGWEVVRPFAREYGINYPVMVDNSTVYKKYGPFRGIPTTFIINREGKIAYVAMGMVPEHTLKSVLEELTTNA